jgi:hypothetical protein
LRREDHGMQKFLMLLHTDPLSAAAVCLLVGISIAAGVVAAIVGAYTLRERLEQGPNETHGATHRRHLRPL